MTQVAANFIPSAGFMLLAGAHPMLHGVWLVLRLTQTYDVHSGFQLDGTILGKLGLTANNAAFHDHHHTSNMGNFGAEHMDWLFGTMDHWVRDGESPGYLEKRFQLGEKAHTKAG